MRNFWQVLLFVIVTSFYVNGQVSIKLNPLLNGKDNQLLTNVYVINQSNQDVILAGQNYRLYYNSNSARFTENVQFYLPKSYTKLELVQHFFNQNATGYGELAFEENLGFINLACDYNLESQKPIVLKSNQELLVFSLSFECNDINTFELKWAEDNITSGYATALNEIAGIVKDSLVALKIHELKIEDGFNKSFELATEDFNAVIGDVYATANDGVDGKTSIKMPTLEYRSGQFAVFGQCRDCDKKIKDLNTKDISLFGKNLVYIQLDEKNKADKFFRQLINMGFANVQIYKVTPFGNLELVKTI
ncbi:MAG TPA: hypothetical protein VK169_03340 [Saprospiraceae bacterium]|nr:hypothetical protein [Saprospiraceae bacterium]